jgi:flagellar protein FlbD
VIFLQENSDYCRKTPPPPEKPMIVLTRINKERFVVNADLIKFVEEVPDTLITLRDDEKMIVRESADEVIRRIIEYVRAVRAPLTQQLSA